MFVWFNCSCISYLGMIIFDGNDFVFDRLYKRDGFGKVFGIVCYESFI